MAQELQKLGARIEELPDGLIVHGSKLKAARVNGHSDHRIVMALALAGLALDEPCVIDTAEAMDVTFPSFVDLMRSLGADMAL
jgi:3-phosphoshikimate 1-carboxyvinyltransferase